MADQLALLVTALLTDLHANSTAELAVQPEVPTFASHHSGAVDSLLDCFGRQYPDLGTQGVSRILFSHKQSPSFYGVVRATKQPSLLHCFANSSDKYIVAVGNLGPQFLDLIEETDGPSKGYTAHDVLDMYKDTCQENHRFRLPCRKELQKLRENSIHGHPIRSQVEKHFNLLETLAALSYIGEELNPGSFCKLDLEGRLNKKIFTRYWKPQYNVIEKCEAEDADNILFLAHSVLL
ncbi:unnamed protein product [Bursaphelenchus xylophilus]|uniref:(pine wood nematode) hypothetical protein n=1 Tax=Bursaphelenchus xylophilus TaxID=6326 RepID=A0A1I7S6V6_BURXY|nr:unnamed protein product [Bursaphelenchus xylophilus]CAG9079715.1 unnamed protein product [Bursaphelenchus xylophilus]